MKELANIQIGNVTVITKNILDKTAEDYVAGMMDRINRIANACGIDVLPEVRQVLVESVLAIQVAERNRLREQMGQDF